MARDQASCRSRTLQVEAEYQQSEEDSKQIEEAMALKGVFSESQEAASFISESSMGAGAEIIPNLHGGSSYLSFYQTPLSSLQSLLELAQTRKRCQEISQEDLKYVIQCCDYPAYFPFAERKKLTKTAIRILGYIAKHQLHLPDSAILALKKELDFKDISLIKTSKIVNYALLAMSYAIHNEKMNIQNNIKPLLLKAIEGIKDARKKEQYPTIIIAYSAVMKLGHSLSQNELLWIKHYLMDVKPNLSHPLYVESHHILEPRLAEDGSTHWWKTSYNELEFLKKKSQARGLLSEDQLLYTQRQWKKTSNKKYRIKILHILKHAITNGQIFKDEQILSQALENDEVKIKQDAIIALNYLVKHDQITRESGLIKKLQKAQAEFRLYGLKALILHCERADSKAGASNLSNSDEWIQIISQLEQNNKLEPYSKYLQFLLKDNLNALNDLLLNKNNSIEASIALLNAAKKNLPFSSEIFHTLNSMIREKYPFEAKLNILLALTCMIENKITIPSSITRSVKEIILNRQDNSLLINASLILLNACSFEHITILLSEKLFDNIYILLDEAKFAHNTSCLIANIVNQAHDKIYIPYIYRIVKKTSWMLSDKNCSLKVKKNICLLISRVAKFNPQYFDKDIIANLTQGLKRNNDENILKQILFSIGTTFEQIDAVLLPADLLNLVIKGLGNISEEWRKASAQILCLFFKKSDAPIQEDTIYEIANYLSNPDSSLLVCEIMEFIAESKRELPQKTLISLAGFLNHKLLESRIFAAKNIYQCSLVQPLPLLVIDKIKNNLTDFSEKVINFLVCALKEVVKPEKLNQKIPEDIDMLAELLAGIAKDYMHKNIITSQNAVHILYQLSLHHKKRLKLNVLITLKSLLSSSYDKLVKKTAKLFDAQISCLELSIKNKNSDLYNLLDNFHEFLKDISIRDILLNMLKKAQTYGYKIPEKTLQQMAKFLLDSKAELSGSLTLSLASSILLECRYLPKSLNWIVELEKQNQILLSKEEKERTKQEAIGHLLDFAQKKMMLTHPCFHALTHILQSKSSLNINILKIFLVCVKNSQELPESVIETLNKIVLDEKPKYPEDLKLATLIISETIIRYGSHLSKAVYVVIESLFVSSEDDLTYLSLIEVAIQRNFQISIDCLNKIKGLLLSNDRSFNYKAAKILACLSGKLPPFFLNELTSLFPLITDANTQKKIGQFLEIQFSKLEQGIDAIDAVKINPLLEILEKSENLEIEKQALIILKALIRNTVTPKNALNLILIKENEFQLLDEKLIITEKIDALKILVDLNHTFSFRNFIAIEKMIRQLYQLDSDLNIPDLLNLLNIFLSISFDKFKLTATFADNIIDIFSHHQNYSIRKSSSAIMIHCLRQNMMDINKHNHFKKLLSIEYFIDKPPDKDLWINNLFAAIQEKLELSANNIDALCHFLGKNNIYLDNKSIFLLAHAQERIPSFQYQNLLDALLIRLTELSISGQEFIDLFLFLLSKPEIFDETIKQAFTILNKQFENGNINSFNLKIFQHCVKEFPLVDIKRAILALIKGFFIIRNEQQLQMNLVNTLTHCLNRNKVIDNYLLNELLQFSRVLQPEIKFSLGLNIFKKIFFPSISYYPEVKHAVCHLLNSISNLYPEFFQSITNKNIDSIITTQFNQQYPNDIKLLSNMKKKDYNSFMLLCLSGHYNELTSILGDTSPDLYSLKLLCHDFFMQIKSEKSSAHKNLFFDYIHNLFPESKDNPQWSTQRNTFILMLKLKQNNENLSLAAINDTLLMLQFYRKFNIIDSPEQFLLDNKAADHKNLWIQKMLSLNYNLNDDSKKKILRTFLSLQFDINMLAEILGIFIYDSDIHNMEICLELLQKIKISHYELIILIDRFEINTIAHLKKNLSNFLIKNQIKIFSEKFLHPIRIEDVKNFKKYKTSSLNLTIQNLINKGWSFDKLYNLLEKFSELRIESKIKFDAINNIFEIAYLYDIKEPDFYRIHNEAKEIDHFSEKLYTEFVNTHFSDNKGEKNFFELNNEIKDFPDSLKKEDLFLIIDRSNNCYNQSNSFLSDFKGNHSLAIKDWSIADIQKWAQYIKSIPDHDKFLPEIIAIIRRACLLHSKYEPRTVQLLAILCLLKKTKLKGRFAQIATGEGKSLIVAILATIKALANEPVDVITSSSILAKRDADHYRPFYQFFGLNVASNEQDKHYRQGVKDCYKQPIVYGDASNFQFDILRHEYSKLGTRGHRGFSVAIIDEVDNLLIDESAKIAMLSSSIAGMNALIPILIALWHELQSLALNHSIDFLLHEKLTDYLIKITEEKTVDFIEIPPHLKKLAKIQGPKWIDSAIMAHKHYKENRDYIIEIDNLNRQVIVPIDYTNTGVLQSGTSWNNGLQQFLQIKHGLQVSPEGLTTNFLSNLALINRYKRNIHGITGTLGSLESQNLLDEAYSIDFVHIPTYKKKRFIELPGMSINSESNWYTKIVDNSIREAQMNRVVLIVCEDINETNKIFEQIRKFYIGKLCKYSKNGESQEQFLEELVDGGTIIVATTLAARGTDIRLSAEAVARGGLHVCCTFLPENRRVEEQIFGRTSRKGEPGSGQLILNNSAVSTKLNLEESNNYSVEQFKKIRDEAEKAQLDKIRKYELPRIKLKDQLFTNYIEMLQELEVVDNDAKTGVIILTEWNLDHSIAPYLMAELKKIKRSSVEERWGVWLKQYDLESNNNLDSKSIDSHFTQFKEIILSEYEKYSIIQNASHWVQLGNTFLKKANSYNPELIWRKNLFLSLAIRLYDQAISIDPLYAHIAYYNKAYTLVKMAKGDYKPEAKKCLRMLIKIFSEKLLPRTQVISNIIENIKKMNNKDLIFHGNLAEQFLNNMQVSNLLLDSALLAIEVIEKSERLIEVRLQTNGKTRIFNKLDKEKCLAVIEKKPESDVQIIFRGLIKHTDCGANYPLIKTMEDFNKHCQKSLKVNIIFDSKELAIKGNLSQTFKKLLPINRNNKFKKIEAKEEKKASEERMELKEDRLIGTAEKLSYCKNQIGSALSEAGRVIAESKAVAKLSDAKSYVSNGAADYYYSYKEAECLLVNLEISQLNLLTTLYLLKEFIEDRAQKICFVIHNPKEKIVKIVSQKKLFLSCVEVIIFDCDPDKNYTMQSKAEIIQIQDELPRTFDLIFSANTKNEALSLLKGLQDELKISEQDDPLLMVNLDLTFYKISQKQADQLLDSPLKAVKLSFNDLTEPNAKPVIYLADEHYNDAIFEFPHLNASESKILVENADRKNQDFSIGSKPLENELLKISPALSILEYKAIGYLFMFDLQEKNPLPWKAMSIVSIAAVLQIAAGATLMVCTAGFGASVGLGLVTEGIADILRVINAGYSRNFSMTDYLIQKSMSMTISLITAGWAAASGAEEAINLVDEAASAANAARQSAMQATTATKCIAIKAGEAFAAEGSRTICSTVSSAVASSMRPAIIKYAHDIVEKEFSAGYIHGVIQKVFAADCFVYENQGNHYEEQIRLAGKESLHNLSFAMPGIELFDLSGVDQFHNNFREKIIGIEKQLKQFNVILHHRLHHVEKMEISQNDVNKICELLAHKKILSENGEINLSEIRKYLPSGDPARANFGNLNLAPYNEHREKLLAACLSYHCAFTDDYSLKINRFSKEIAALLADRFQASVDTAGCLAGSAAAGLINWGVSNQSDKLRKQITLDDLSQGIADKIPEGKMPLDESSSFELKTGQPLSANNKMRLFSAPKDRPDHLDELAGQAKIPRDEIGIGPGLQEDMKRGACPLKIGDGPAEAPAGIFSPPIKGKTGDCLYDSLSPHFNNCSAKKMRMDMAAILGNNYEANPDKVIRNFSAHLKKCLSNKNLRVGLPEDICKALKKIGGKMGDLDLMLEEYAKECFPRYLDGIKKGEIWGDFFQLESFAKAKRICVAVKTINPFTRKNELRTFGNKSNLKLPDKAVRLYYDGNHYSSKNFIGSKSNMDPYISRGSLASASGIGGIEITDPKLPSNLKCYRHELRGRTVFFTQGKRSVSRGSATTAKVRAYCNNPASPAPSRFSQRSSIGSFNMRTETDHPVLPGTKDAGHLFPRQLGGPGHMEGFIIPQNPAHNRGGDWREHEKLLCSESDKNPEKIVSHVVVAYHSSSARL